MTLTAVADSGWLFHGWSGDLTGDENPATVNMDENKSVTATFVQTFLLSTAVEGSGRLIIDPDQETYFVGDEVTLTAVPDPGWVFSGWSGDAAGRSNPLTVTMDSDKNIVASFSKSTIYLPAVLRS